MELNQAQKNLIDQFAALSQQYAPVLKQLEALQKQVNSIAAAQEGNGAVTLSGDKFSLDYSAKTTELKCIFTPEEFIDHTGAWGALKVGVTEAKKILTAEQMDDLFATQLGSRRFQRVRINDVQAYVTAMPTAAAKKSPQPVVTSPDVEPLEGATARKIG
jgi:hypothetical protein